jgi:hypothetical protein
VRLRGHAPVLVENTFAPGDTLTPDGLPIALTMQSVFTRLFTNTFETADVERIALKVDSAPGRQSFTIDSAWLEKGEAAPGETLRVRVLVHPYRGAPRVEETTVRVPEQTARGTMLRVLVTDADLLNRASRGFSAASATEAGGLDQLIALLNRERRNDRVYVGLFSPSPTLLWNDKELPNVPLSQINVVDGRPAPGTVQVLRESLAGESSIPLGGPVAGVISLNLQIRCSLNDSTLRTTSRQPRLRRSRQPIALRRSVSFFRGAWRASRVRTLCFRRTHATLAAVFLRRICKRYGSWHRGA